MPGYFKRRRGHNGPNKNEAKVIRAHREEVLERQAGTLSSHFPEVGGLRVHLTFLGAHQQLLEEKDLAFKPGDTAIFTAACPGRCGRGVFDLSEKIAAMVGERLGEAEDAQTCPETIFGGSAQVCGGELRCRIEIDYLS